MAGLDATAIGEPAMTAKRHLVALTREQRRELEAIVRTGARKAFPRRRAQIWLQADQGPHGPAWPTRPLPSGWGWA